MLLCQFAFYSRRTWTAANKAEDEVYLRDILDAGLRNNPAHGLTGVLLVDGPHFVQVLEGRRSPLYRTLKRIENNPHHGDLVLTGYSEVSERMFGDWSVFVRTPPDGLAGTPWIPNPQLATHGQLVDIARRVSSLTTGVTRILSPGPVRREG
ncbi:BLUF domain-containing protein [Maricaulis sp.]|uniref:BLUF domain-containing protein n=1 Tax=Maricaulis sp. TaxID=1486257 RepID=UPI003A9277D0|tara:strand:- start:4323 stop:4778 length:456 start_codon:yes stop_codon:yes gene_type:complete